MKYNLGDLVYYNPRESLNMDPLDFGAYWMLHNEYGRPEVIVERGNIGLITKVFPANELFLRNDELHNAYVWHSQQTGKEYVVFQAEIETVEEYNNNSYQSSWLGKSLLKKKRKKK